MYATGNIPVGFSDHNLVYMAYKTCPVKVKPRVVKTRTYRKFSDVAFQNDLTNVNWDVIFQTENPETAWAIFKDKL